MSLAQGPDAEPADVADEARTRLVRLEIGGFRSIRSCDVQLEDINVLIGANGAGKSNLVSFVRMLNYLASGALQRFVAESGGASSNLHFGAKVTPQIETRLTFETKTGTTVYYARLFHVAPDELAFADENVTFHRRDREAPQQRPYGAGHRESGLIAKSKEGDKTAAVTRKMLSECRAYQFHDTSSTARMRQTVEVDSNFYLRADGGNLAAVLYLLKQNKGEYYDRIVSTIRQVAPFFGDFVLEPHPLNPRYVSLRWMERDSDYEFGPHQLSDGTLRAIALITLFLLPEEMMPRMILVDEPELGLHPSAIATICALVRHASLSSQILLATQSSAMLDEFEAKDVIVVDRAADAGRSPSSVFRRLDPVGLKHWTEEYSLAELWDKNVLGGRPAR